MRFMKSKWVLNEQQLKELLLVSKVVIGAPIEQGEDNETSTCIKRKRTAFANKQHKTNTLPTEK